MGLIRGFDGSGGAGREGIKHVSEVGSLNKYMDATEYC